MAGLARGHVTWLHPICILEPAHSRSRETHKGGAFSRSPLSRLRRAGNLCQPPFSHWYQLLSLRLMFEAQKGCGRTRVGGVGKRKDLRPLWGSTAPGPGRAHLGAHAVVTVLTLSA